MERLTPETLARLVQETPTPEEEEALAADPGAAEELEAMRCLVGALRTLPEVRPPRGDWESLEARLVSEGLLPSPAAGAPRRSPLLPNWLQIAAGMVLFLAGTGVGAGFRAPSAIPPVAEAAGASAAYARVAGEARTLEEAAELVRLTEQPYYAALARFRELSELSRGQGEWEIPVGQDPVVRMAALEALLAASQAAIRRAPGDPFLNGVLVSAAAEREAQLRRLSQVPDRWF